MYTFKVGGETYRVRFSYGVICQTDLIDKLLQSNNDTNTANIIKNTIGLTGELLLAGLQKYHKDEFGYIEMDENGNIHVDPDKKLTGLMKVYDLIDDYEDESYLDEKTGEICHDAVTLLDDLQSELEKNGFLSRLSKMGQETAESQNAEVIPKDHQTKRKATVRKS